MLKNDSKGVPSALESDAKRQVVSKNVLLNLMRVRLKHFVLYT